MGWISSSLWSIVYIKAIRSPEAYRAITGRDIPKREEDPEALFNFKIVVPASDPTHPSHDVAAADDGSSSSTPQPRLIPTVAAVDTAPATKTLP